MSVTDEQEGFSARFYLAGAAGAVGGPTRRRDKGIQIMATKKQSRSSKAVRRRPEAVPEDTRVKYEIGGILLGTFGAVILVALTLGIRGPAGDSIQESMFMLFGLGAPAVPLAIIVAGGYLCFALAPVPLSPRLVALAYLWVIGLAGLHCFSPEASEFEADVLMVHGGYLGAILCVMLRRLFGSTGAWIILGGLALAAATTLLRRPVAYIAQDACAYAGGAAHVARARLSAYTEDRRRQRLARSKERQRRETERASRQLVPSSRFRRQRKEIDGGAGTASCAGEPDGQYPLFPEEHGPGPIDDDLPDGFTQGGERIREEDIPAFLRATAPQGSGARGKAPGAPHLEAVPRRQGPYEPPAAELLDAPSPIDVRRQERETRENIAILEDTLASFKIGAKVVSIERGPAITRYEVEPDKGIRVARIAALADDLARVLEAVDVRIEAPVPGTSVVGIEVPNRTRGLVTLRDILTSEEMASNSSLLAFALGKDIAGRVVVGDLARMPHLLVAGATNSGKSVCLNALILSIVFRASPDEVKFLMIDPKRVELSLYDEIPHLIAPVVHDAKEAAGLLRHAIVEMEQRYRTLAGLGVRNITEYVELREERDDLERMPYIVIVIDELADLMMQAAAEFEHSICRIAQLARAVGIHLVVATQRPSVNVVTGTIKANIPSRIAFAVSSQTDSRVILDQVGADRLIGQGDMLYSPIDASKPKRIQGAYVSVKEINRVVQYLRSWGDPEFELEPLPVDTMKGPVALPTGVDDDGVDDDLFGEIVGFVTTQKRVSTSMLQRKFRIGYNRAARLIDILEEKGVVGPADGSKPRRVIAGLAGTSLDLDDDDEGYDEATG